MHILYTLVLKVATTDNTVHNTTKLEEYKERCRDMADFLLNTVGPSKALEDLEVIRTLYLTKREFYNVSGLRKNDKYSIIDMGQYACSDSGVERKIFVNKALMDQLDRKIAEYLAWLNSETTKIYVFDAYDLIYRALAFRLTNTIYLLQLYQTVHRCDRDMRAKMKSVRGNNTEESIQRYFERLSDSFRRVFSNWHDDLTESEKSITSLYERYNNKQSYVLSACEDLKDQTEAFRDLKKHCNNLDTLIQYNSLLFDVLLDVNRGNNDKKFCHELTEFLHTCLDCGRICAKLFGRELVKYLAMFNNPETKTVALTHLNRIYKRYDGIIRFFILTYDNNRRQYRSIVMNYNEDNIGDKIVAAYFHSKNKAVIAEFVKSASLIGSFVNKELPEFIKEFVKEVKNA